MPEENDTPLTEEEQELARRGKDLIAAAVADVQAPASLREAIEHDRERATARSRPSFWRRYSWGLAAAGAAAVALVAVVITLGTGETQTEPSLTQVYAAAQLASTEPAPGLLGGTPPVLDANVGELEFPDWRETFGWKAVGRREDTLAGRPVTTVFYRNPEGAQLGYAVVAGDSLDQHPSGSKVTRDGNTYTVARHGERTFVTWIQQGHTCVIVAPSVVPRARLVDLAASRNV